jgi:hypothetical protein
LQLNKGNLIWGSHGSKQENYCHLEYDIVQSSSKKPTFLRDLLPTYKNNGVNMASVAVTIMWMIYTCHFSIMLLILEKKSMYFLPCW